VPPPLRNSPTGTRRDEQDDDFTHHGRTAPDPLAGPVTDPVTADAGRSDPPGPPQPPSDGDTATADDEPTLITPRQLLRWAAVIGALVVAVLACWQDPGYAGPYSG